MTNLRTLALAASPGPWRVALDSTAIHSEHGDGASVVDPMTPSEIRALVEAATPVGEYGPYTDRHMQVTLPLEPVIALLSENERLRAALVKARVWLRHSGNVVAVDAIDEALRTVADGGGDEV